MSGKQTETLDKLYLELSQFTGALNEREVKARRWAELVHEALLMEPPQLDTARHYAAAIIGLFRNMR